MHFDDGYRLWFRYDPLGAAAAPYDRILQRIVAPGDSPTLRILRDELRTALTGLLGRDVPAATEDDPGSLVVRTDATDLPPEGFTLRTTDRVTINAATGVGALYGVFHLLRLLQMGQPIDTLDLRAQPRLQLRLLNHWDNLDGSIERGYAGRSLWKWSELPDTLDARYTDYARACASVAINGSVVNNVNTDPRILSSAYLEKVAALADVWRPYGVRAYLSINFASPRQIGGLDSNDPRNPDVQRWWKTQADEIYARIPDFGGFVVKANSEGQPGPQDYGRTHADGANLLADALAPHGGIVMWRAFVYNPDVDADRIKRAYMEFTALDGDFRDNVVVQVKNGPLDFMPREPFHPLFGAMRRTPVMAELQAAQEYLGHSKHLVYLGTMWKEFLDADTFAPGNRPGSTVGRVLEGGVHPYRLTGICAVANTGSDRNWCGHDFSQANWYAFGRLAWDHALTAEGIAQEWVRMTLTRDDAAVRTIVGLMMGSRETFVRYTMPLGLHHLIGGDHYAPMPWVEKHEHDTREDWTATFYHRADRTGIGWDRTRRGNAAVDQYFPPLCDLLDDPRQCPEEYLLWFHRLPWDHLMSSGRTLWGELCHCYQRGAAEAAQMAATWRTLEGRVNPGPHQRVRDRFDIQVRDAARWRDECLAYFQRFSGMPVEPA